MSLLDLAAEALTVITCMQQTSSLPAEIQMNTVKYVELSNIVSACTLEHVETAVIMLGCRQDMEIEIDRFEMARAQIAEVGCSGVLVSRLLWWNTVLISAQVNYLI